MPLLAVTKALLERGIDYQMIVHPPAETARDVAESMRSDIYDVLKVVAIRTRAGYALAVLRGIDRVDLHRVKRALYDDHARLATDHEIAEAFPGFDPGCLPPLGSLVDVESLVDPSVFGTSDVIFSSGRKNLSVKASATDLFADPSVRVVPIRRRAPWEDPNPSNRLDLVSNS
jgi:prolyl-tRNA editing enzyme YbaK/EbsC (Cys-tRNA(Pro) deacylase)